MFVCSIRWISSAGFPQSAGFPRQTPRSTSETSWWSLCTPTGMLSEHKQTLVMKADYCVVKIDGLNVYAPVGTPESKLTRDHVVLGGKSRKTFKMGPIKSTTHPLVKREEFIPVAPCTHTSLTLPRQVTLIFLLKCCPTVTWAEWIVYCVPGRNLQNRDRFRRVHHLRIRNILHHNCRDGCRDLRRMPDRFRRVVQWMLHISLSM